MRKAADDRLDPLLAHAEQLRALAWCLARDDGADLLQDTWVAAMQSRGPPRSAGPWLQQIMRNEFRQGVRAAQRRRTREVHTPHESLSPPSEHQAIHTELVLVIHEVLDGLPDPYRSVVRERFFCGRSLTAIAASTRKPTATVRWQLHEGLKRIRAGLDARYGDRRHWHGGALAIGAWPQKQATKLTTMTPHIAFKWLAGLSLTAAGGVVAVMQVATLPQVSAAVDSTDASEPFRPVTPMEIQTDHAGRMSSPNAFAMSREPIVPVPTATNDQTRPWFALSNSAGLKQAFEACEHLLPPHTPDGRYEIEITVRGGPEEVGNTITAASVTRGRKMPCADPDADFDEVDGPDVMRFDSVAECVQYSLSPSFVDPLPDGEERLLGAVLQDDAVPAVGPALPAPSVGAKNIDPETAITHFELADAGGSPAPAIRVVECGGYECSFCNRARATVSELRERYGDAMAFYFLQLPLDMHPAGALKARAAVAAGMQGKGWLMHEAMFDEPLIRSEAGLTELAGKLGLDTVRFTRDLADPATAQLVADQREVCQTAGARGTPSFFINGDLLVGSQEIAAFAAIIDDELAGQRQESEPQ